MDSVKLDMLYYKRGEKNKALQAFEQVLRLKPSKKLQNWVDRYKAR